MRYNEDREGNIYSASFSSVAVTTSPTDLFGVLASTSPISRVEILSIDLSVVSTAVPQGALANIQLLRGSTASSTSTALTPTNLKGWSGAPTAGSSVTQPSSTPVSTASATQIWASAFNLNNGWQYPPYQEMSGLSRPVLASGQRLHVRLTALSSAVNMSGTVQFRERGGGNAA